MHVWRANVFLLSSKPLSHLFHRGSRHCQSSLSPLDVCPFESFPFTIKHSKFVHFSLSLTFIRLLFSNISKWPLSYTSQTFIKYCRYTQLLNKCNVTITSFNKTKHLCLQSLRSHECVCHITFSYLNYKLTSSLLSKPDAKEVLNITALNKLKIKIEKYCNDSTLYGLRFEVRTVKYALHCQIQDVSNGCQSWNMALILRS